MCKETELHNSGHFNIHEQVSKDNNQPGAPIICSRWIIQENDCEKMKARIVARDYEREALFVDTPTIDKTSLI